VPFSGIKIRGHPSSVVLEDSRPRMTRRHQSSDRAHRDAQPANAGPPAHHLRVESDSIQRLHAQYSNRALPWFQLLISMIPPQEPDSGKERPQPGTNMGGGSQVEAQGVRSR